MTDQTLRPKFPSKSQMKRREIQCTTHHYACDCREAEFERLKEEMKNTAIFAAKPFADENRKLQAQLEKAKEALKFYADLEHFEFGGCDKTEDDYEPDTVSGEPENYQCGKGLFTFEDGGIARDALKELSE